jgi:hypothetical protein
MKKSIIITIILALSLSSCSKNKEDPIDLAGELNSQPEVTLLWDNSETLKGSNGGFCSAILCFDQGTPSPESFSYTDYQNGIPLTIQIAQKNTPIPIKDIFITLKDKNWKTIQNNIPYDMEESGGYTIPNNFKKTGNVILNVKITWEEGGYSNAYFPLNIK